MEVFCGVIVFSLMLFVLFVLRARSVVVYEATRMPKIRDEVEAEDNAAIIHDVNHALQARRNAMNKPTWRELQFDARGKLAQWEAGRRR